MESLLRQFAYGKPKDAPAARQLTTDVAILAKIECEDLERVVRYGDEMQRLIAGADRR